MTTTTILLIEDDPAVGQSLQDGLERDSYHVIWERTGSDGVVAAQTHNPRLIILDIRLPDGNGFDFCRDLRQKGLKQPIIMLTARHDETDKVLGLEMGADDYVTKPFSLRELLSRIRAQLRRAYGDLSTSDGDYLYIRDLIIDRGRNQVRRGNTILPLSPTEFRLLVYMAQNVGHALSRTQILDAVWGYAADVDSERVVNVTIRRLREKIEIDPSRPTLILTAVGIGYRLVA